VTVNQPGGRQNAIGFPQPDHAHNEETNSVIASVTQEVEPRPLVATRPAANPATTSVANIAALINVLQRFN